MQPGIPPEFWKPILRPRCMFFKTCAYDLVRFGFIFQFLTWHWLVCRRAKMVLHICWRISFSDGITHLYTPHPPLLYLEVALLCFCTFSNWLLISLKIKLQRILCQQGLLLLLFQYLFFSIASLNSGSKCVFMVQQTEPWLGLTQTAPEPPLLVRPNFGPLVWTLGHLSHLLFWTRLKRFVQNKEGVKAS